MYLYPKDIIEIEKTEFGFSLMKHANKYWYVSFSNPQRWHCTYCEEKYYARISVFENNYGPELFLVKGDYNELP